MFVQAKVAYITSIFSIKIDYSLKRITKQKHGMGIKGLYSCLKSYALPVTLELEKPLVIGLDAYAFLYKYREDIDSCITFLKRFQAAGHTLSLYLDGVPPKEKEAELLNRKVQKETAYKQAKALKAFLNDEKSKELTEDARNIIAKQIASYEHESWYLRKEIRETFAKRVSEQGIEVIQCKGEADTDLIVGSLSKKLDCVIANDMDLFVGGVERLWILGKTHADPLLQEIRRSYVSYEVGITEKAWADVAILAGYEKCPHLRRCSAHQAIIWLRYYGSIEALFSRRHDLLQGAQLKEFQDSRQYLCFKDNTVV
jgi:hypothetical protein